MLFLYISRIPPLPPTVTSLHSFTVLLLGRSELHKMCSADMKKIGDYMKLNAPGQSVTVGSKLVSPVSRTVPVGNSNMYAVSWIPSPVPSVLPIVPNKAGAPVDHLSTASPATALLPNGRVNSESDVISCETTPSRSINKITSAPSNGPHDKMCDSAGNMVESQKNIPKKQENSVVILVEEQQNQSKPKTKSNKKSSKTITPKIKSEYEVSCNKGFETGARSEFEFRQSTEKRDESSSAKQTNNKPKENSKETSKNTSQKNTTQFVFNTTQQIQTDCNVPEYNKQKGIETVSVLPLPAKPQIGKNKVNESKWPVIKPKKNIPVLSHNKKQEQSPPSSIVLEDNEKGLYDQLIELRKTHEYKLLKERMFSIFMWPALLSTIPVTNDDKQKRAKGAGFNIDHQEASTSGAPPRCVWFHYCETFK